MIKQIISIIISTSMLTGLNAQITSPSVIASAGNSGFNQVYSLSWTVGEAIIHTYELTETSLLQGFHQPNYEVNVFVEEPDSDYDISIFPNPTSDWINIEVDGMEDDMKVRLYDLYGKLIMNDDLELPLGGLDLGDLPAATYLIMILNNENERVGTWKVQKIW